jgi:hypothetical protein
MFTAGTKRASNQGSPADPGRVTVRAGSKVQPQPRLLRLDFGGSRQRAWHMAKSARTEAAVPVLRPGHGAHAGMLHRVDRCRVRSRGPSRRNRLRTVRRVRRGGQRQAPQKLARLQEYG